MSSIIRKLRMKKGKPARDFVPFVDSDDLFDNSSVDAEPDERIPKYVDRVLKLDLKQVGNMKVKNRLVNIKII